MHAALAPKMLALHVFAVLAVGFAAVLGWWQLSVWQEARTDKAAALAQADAVPLPEVLTPSSAFEKDSIGQPVTVRGRWAPNQEPLFIADRQIGRTAGYWLVHLFESDGAVLPVVRGFVPDAVPPTGLADLPAGEVDLTGWLQPGEPAFGEDLDPSDNVYPALRLADLLTRSDRDFYSGYLIQRDDVDAAVRSVTPEQLPKPDTFTSVRNLLYGIEWWFFGLFAVFLWWRWTTDEIERVKSLSLASQEQATVHDVG